MNVYIINFLLLYNIIYLYVQTCVGKGYCLC